MGRREDIVRYEADKWRWVRVDFAKDTVGIRYPPWYLLAPHRANNSHHQQSITCLTSFDPLLYAHLSVQVDLLSLQLFFYLEHGLPS